MKSKYPNATPVEGGIQSATCPVCSVAFVYNMTPKIPACPCKGRNPVCPNPSTEETDFVSGNVPVAGTFTDETGKSSIMCGPCLRETLEKRAIAKKAAFMGQKGGRGGNPIQNLLASILSEKLGIPGPDGEASPGIQVIPLDD